jgi:hypothetical protein
MKLNRITAVDLLVGDLAAMILVLCPAEVEAQSCVEPPAGLVSWWPGDGTADDIQDGNDGQLEGGATFAGGKFGEAFSFDGIDDHIVIGNPENLKLGQGDYTVAAWVNLTSLNAPDGSGFCSIRGCNLEIVSKMGLGEPGPPNQNGWRLLKEADDQFWFIVGAPDGGGSGEANVVRSRCLQVVPGRWYHLAAVKSSQEIALYVSGILQASKPLPSNHRNDDVADVVIGQYPEEPEGTMYGLIEEVEIFGRALSADEIRTIYESRTCKPGATTTTTTTGVTTTTMLSLVCGDANGDGSITASDALLALRAAVGASDCDFIRCDVTGEGHIGATDALLILYLAVGVPLEANCWEPPCP